MAEQLREIVRRQADAAFRQIEAELMPHRPAQPRIDSRRRRPDAFDQAAENQTGRNASAALPAGRRCVVETPTRFGPAHDAIGEQGLEGFGIIARQRDDAGLVAGISSKALASALPCGPSNAARCHRRRSSSAHQHLAMTSDRSRRGRAAAWPARLSSGASAAAKRVRSVARPDRAHRRAIARAARRDAAARARRARACRVRREIAKTPGRDLSSAAAAGCRVGPPAPASAIARCQAPGPSPNRSSGCFSSDSSVAGSSPAVAASAASRAKMPAGVSTSASPPESSNGRSQRPSAAITRRASARSGVTSAAGRSSCIASRSATAMASASISELSAAITERLCMPAAIRASTSGSRKPLVPARGGGRGPQRLGRQQFAAVRCGLAELHHVAAFDLQMMLQQRMQRELRMVRRGRGQRLPCASCVTADQRPRLVVEIGIEPRQHHRALRQLRDRGEEARGRRHRAGGAGRDHRPARLRGEPLGFGVDQQVAAQRRLDQPLAPPDEPAMPRARSSRNRATAANIGRARRAPGRRAPSSRRRASPCRRSAAPDRWRARWSRPGRRPPAAQQSDRRACSCLAQAATSCASVSRRSSSLERRR